MSKVDRIIHLYKKDPNNSLYTPSFRIGINWALNEVCKYIIANPPGDTPIAQYVRELKDHFEK